MSLPGQVKIFSPRGQVIALLLHVLANLKGDQRKLHVTACIRMWEIFAFADEDRTPYPSVKEMGGDEPRWTTLVAFARLDCVERGWMEDRGRDKWRISAVGQQILGKLKTRCSEGLIDVRHGYLWTPKFKRVLSPAYEPAVVSR